MAYVLTAPPRLKSNGGLYGAGQTWVYSSADAAATVAASGYFSNGGDLGMKVGDLVEVAVTGTGAISTHRVVTVSAAAPGAVDLGDATVIGATGNAG